MVEEIRRNLDVGSYRSAAGLSAQLIERAFRQATRNSLGLMGRGFRGRFSSVEEEIGGGGLGFEDFTLGQLVALFQKTGFLSAWSELSGRDLRGFSIIDLNAIVKMRNALTHVTHQVTRTEAELLFTSSQVIVESLGLLEPDTLLTETPAAPQQEKSGPPRDAVKARGREASRYQPERGMEYDRLQIQADRTLGLDRSMLRSGLDRMGRDGLLALDLGCGDGRITMSRLAHFDEFELILGMDQSRFLLDKAEKHASDRVRFSHQDVEAMDFDERLREALEELGRSTIDVVLSTVTLHHLAAPIRVLRTLRTYLAEDGFVAVRAKDDGSRLAYPDREERVSGLIEATAQSPGVADRTSGRKLYWQLRRAGLCDIEFFPAVYHTVGMGREERHELFLEAFSFRRNYMAQVVERDPSDDEARESLAEIDRDLDELELDFESEDFFYLELAFGLVAFR